MDGNCVRGWEIYRPQFDWSYLWCAHFFLSEARELWYILLRCVRGRTFFYELYSIYGGSRLCMNSNDEELLAVVNTHSV